MAKSSSHENRVVGYVDPYIHRLVEADKIVNGVSESKVVNEALRAHYNKMPEKDRQTILDRSKNSY